MWGLLLLDRLLGILVLLSSVPGSILLDWNKPRYAGYLPSWRDGGSFSLRMCQIPLAELSWHRVAATDATRSHLRGAVFRVRPFVPVVPAS